MSSETRGWDCRQPTANSTDISPVDDLIEHTGIGCSCKPQYEKITKGEDIRCITEQDAREHSATSPWFLQTMHRAIDGRP